ncbi:MAG: excinuclease ABC subunit UvrA [Xanthomonadaceae bacterium]|nr:excinuclease ABC subunit UvrA [Xanthomonadaceae bacterium]
MESLLTHPVLRHTDWLMAGKKKTKNSIETDLVILQPKPSQRPIRLFGVRHNNLKNINVEFPSKKLTVVTGLSGSGKSSLAFETLYAEGQRRFVESLSTYTRQFMEKMPKPDLDGVENIPPSIALEQRNRIVNSRMTVGTQTEIVDFLRILFAKIGHTFCINCGKPVVSVDADLIHAHALKWFVSRKGVIAAPFSKPAYKKIKLENIFQMLKEQGYRRLLWTPTKNKRELLDLEDLGSDVFPAIPMGAVEKEQLYVVTDRLKLGADIDTETKTRIRDSVEQALMIGRQNIYFIDLDTGEKKHYKEQFACSDCGTEHRLPEPMLFSFNSPLGACKRCSGFGFLLDIDEKLVVPDLTKTLKNGAIDPLSKPSFAEWQDDLFRFVERHGISIGKKYQDLTKEEKRLIWQGDTQDKTFPGILKFFDELAKKKYKLHIRVFIRRYQSQTLCPECEGSRLSREARAVKIGEKTMPDVVNSSIIDSLAWLKDLKLSPNDKKISRDAFEQIERRLSFLDEVGVGYLTLSRLAKTLSGGEYQRINLATQLGNGLCGTLYVLDEPSIGLHAADTDRLIKILKRLRDQGNTVVVVEHDLEVMRCADYLIEMGPGAGRRGGECVDQGTREKFISSQVSLTSKYLSGALKVVEQYKIPPPHGKVLKITGCSEHNLKNITVEFPLRRWVVVTGPSGSGKSTLIHQTLYPALARVYKSEEDLDSLEMGRYDKLYGAEYLAGVVMLDQKPIGKNSRSNPATYMKAWDEIRRIYANQVLSSRRGYTPQHFSFNVDSGRCTVCGGEGEITLDMHFMADIKLPCDECGGKRFKKAILDVMYQGKNISDLLHTTIDEAFDLFRSNTVLHRKFSILREVGLGYLMVGQSAPTLSGGESQRLKIAAALDERQGDNLLYLFDEPTTGLHSEDVKKLMSVVRELVERGHSVIMIEHNLDMISASDHVIDLGPEGGENGGYVSATGAPDQLMELEKSITGKMLERAGYVFPARPERPFV